MYVLYINSYLEDFTDVLFRFFCSLKLAVVVVLLLALALTVGTFTESYFDIKTGQYWVYRALWFKAILVMLGVNIFCVLISRYPWRKHHLPFFLAHVGIISLLIGSVITQKFGVDGNLVIGEGESQKVVELDSQMLLVDEGDHRKSFDMPWIPPHVEFKTKEFQQFGFKIDQYITHAEPVLDFVPVKDPSRKDASPAMQLRLSGGPLPFPRDFWMWGGATSTSSIQMGPAHFSLNANSAAKTSEIKTVSSPQAGQAKLELRTMPDGALVYRAISKSGKAVSGSFSVDKTKGGVINPDWMGMTIEVLSYVPQAVSQTTYKASRMQYGNEAPSPALHLSAKDNSTGVWLGLGDQATFKIGSREISVAYMPRQVVLPFAVGLEKFSIEHYQGTFDPASFSSRVRVIDPEKGLQTGSEPIVISMNEPLDYRGYTFYQASYIPGEPRPTTTVLSVNQDPGRTLKYFGSILIVVGSTLLFARKYRTARAAKKGNQSV